MIKSISMRPKSIVISSTLFKREQYQIPIRNKVRISHSNAGRYKKRASEVQNWQAGLIAAMMDRGINQVFVKKTL